MTVVAVGARLDQDRPVAGPADLGGTADRVADGEDVHPVDDLGVHVARREPGRPLGEVADAHDLDGPVGRIGAKAGISPQAEGLERAFLPSADDIHRAAQALL